MLLSELTRNNMKRGSRCNCVSYDWSAPPRKPESETYKVPSFSRKPKVVKEQADAASSSRHRRFRLIRRNLRKEGLSWEPVAILPPEIVTMCLLQALPSSTSDDYPLRLLDLLSVSRRWEKFLFSTPSFWTTIHVQYRSHDLLAIIALFAHLSGQEAMKLVICNDIGREWDAIRSLLQPHVHRIYGITLGEDLPIYIQSPTSDAGYISLATKIVKSFGCLPSLSEIDFGRGLKLRPSQLTLVDLPSNARVRNSIEVSLQNSAIGNLFLTGCVSDGAPDDTRMDYEQSVRDEFVLKNELGAVDDKSTTIFAINSAIAALTDALDFLDNRFTGTNTLATSPCANFMSGTRCLLCGREKNSISRVLGCVRSHFEAHPFQSTGCRSCSATNGYARFCTSQPLSNHGGPAICAICGRRPSSGLELALDGESRNIEEVLMLHEECKRVWRSNYHGYVILPDLDPGMPADSNLWKALYAEAMQYMQPIIMGMGLFFQKRREKTELEAVIQKSIILLKQRLWIDLDLFLPIQSLEEMVGFFRPCFQEYQEQIRTIAVLAPELYHLVNPSEVDLTTLGGLLPSHHAIRGSDLLSLGI